jgi:hypothetical protein
MLLFIPRSLCALKRIAAKTEHYASRRCPSSDAATAPTPQALRFRHWRLAQTPLRLGLAATPGVLGHSRLRCR